MNDDTVLVELRFDSNASDYVETCVASLCSLDVQRGNASRDPSLAATLTVAAAATKLAIELIRLAKELRRKSEKKRIVVVKLDETNRERTISLLDASEAELKQFVSGE